MSEPIEPVDSFVQTMLNIAVVILLQRAEEQRGVVAGQAVKTIGSDDADHLRLVALDRHATADRILAGKKLSGKGAVDDDDEGRSRSIVAVKSRPASTCMPRVARPSCST